MTTTTERSIDRSILEIVIAAKDQAPATDQELRLVVVSLSQMLHIVEQDLRKLCDAVRDGKQPLARMRADFAVKEREVRFLARKKSPRQYLGEAFTPGTAENDRLKKTAALVFEKATGQKL